MVELVAKRYAKALIESGDDTKIDAYIEVLDSIASVLNEEKAKEIIDSPLVSGSEKTAWITESLGTNADPVLAGLIQVMGEKSRLGLIPELVSILKFERKKASNAFVGQTYSKVKLEAAELKRLEKALSDHSGALITLEQMDSDLNGIKVEVEDLGLELNFSKDRVKESLIDFIQKAL